MNERTDRKINEQSMNKSTKKEKKSVWLSKVIKRKTAYRVVRDLNSRPLVYTASAPTTEPPNEATTLVFKIAAMTNKQRR